MKRIGLNSLWKGLDIIIQFSCVYANAEYHNHTCIIINVSINHNDLQSRLLYCIFIRFILSNSGTKIHSCNQLYLKK